jgi:diguanylate cyclase (GGDEF)-like protein
MRRGRTLAPMARRRAFIVTAAGFAFLFLIWWAERLTAPDDFRFGFVYLFPVAAVAWWGPRRAAIVCAGLAAIGLVANDLAYRAVASPLANVWNEFTRIVTILAIALSLMQVRILSERARHSSERAFQMAITDPLTGLYNRRYLSDQLQRLHASAVRTRRGYALIAIDADDFKSINDSFGHAVGDKALISLAQDLRTAIRAGDMAVRVGGDEFVAVLPDAELNDAVGVAHRLRQRVASRTSPQEIRSVSAAVVSWRLYTSPDDLLIEADQLVYESKRAGGGVVKTPSTAY